MQTNSHQPDRLSTIEADIRSLQTMVVTQVIGQLAVIIDGQNRHADYQRTCDGERKAMEIRIVRLETFQEDIEHDIQENSKTFGNRVNWIIAALGLVTSIAAVLVTIRHV